ncbi:MAG: type II toxin-antitoxin system PemK/MazF family toxin [Campylobacterota bacterium]|nr:type II toxin-antitoxin system PemK/MazF family toxin [Campylobacterota bacterium]
MRIKEIVLVDLNPTRGAQIQKARPCIIVSNDDIGVLPLKVIVPLIGHKESHNNKSWLVPIAPTPQLKMSFEVLQIKGVVALELSI